MFLGPPLFGVSEFIWEENEFGLQRRLYKARNWTINLILKEILQCFFFTKTTNL